MTARPRRARPSDLPRLCAIERVAGEPFRALGMDFVADDDTWTIAELEPYQREGRAWVVDGADGVPLAYLLAEEVGGDGRRLLEAAAAWAREHGLDRAPRVAMRRELGQAVAGCSATLVQPSTRRSNLS